MDELTYMSIEDAVKERLRRKELFCFRSGAVNLRTLLVSFDIHGPLSEEEGEWGAVHDGLLRFVEGRQIAVRKDGLREDRETSAYLSRLARDNGAPEEIWDIRILDTDPQIRILGRFAIKTDLFIALTWYDRDELRNGDDWVAAMFDCEHAWRQFFGVCEPLKGDFPSAYLSNFQVVS